MTRSPTGFLASQAGQDFPRPRRNAGITKNNQTFNARSTRSSILGFGGGGDIDIIRREISGREIYKVEFL